MIITPTHGFVSLKFLTSTKTALVSSFNDLNCLLPVNIFDDDKLGAPHTSQGPLQTNGTGKNHNILTK